MKWLLVPAVLVALARAQTPPPASTLNITLGPGLASIITPTQQTFLVDSAVVVMRVPPPAAWPPAPAWCASDAQRAVDGQFEYGCYRGSTGLKAYRVMIQMAP